MKKIGEYGAVYSIGAAGYGAMELAFRGWTHWSMLLAGGTCLIAIYRMSELKLKRWQQCLLGALTITAVELTAGLMINIMLGWEVWDYSHMPLNLRGQICLPFCLLWLALCVPVTALCPALRRLLTGRGRKASA